MKKIFWTTIFRLVVVLGFVLYMKSFDADMANTVASWIGATNFVTQDKLTTGDTNVTLTDIQDMLKEIQKTLNDIAGTKEVVPLVEVESTVESTPEVIPGATAE